MERVINSTHPVAHRVQRPDYPDGPQHLDRRRAKRLCGTRFDAVYVQLKPVFGEVTYQVSLAAGDSCPPPHCCSTPTMSWTKVELRRGNSQLSARMSLGHSEVPACLVYAIFRLGSEEALFPHDGRVVSLSRGSIFFVVGRPLPLREAR